MQPKLKWQLKVEFAIDKTLLCSAESSVGIMYRSSGPNTGSNPGGGRIPKNLLLGWVGHFSVVLCLV